MSPSYFSSELLFNWFVIICCGLKFLHDVKKIVVTKRSVISVVMQIRSELDPYKTLDKTTVLTETWQQLILLIAARCKEVPLKRSDALDAHDRS